MEHVRHLLAGTPFNDDGSLKSPAYVTVVHNGILLHHHFELKGRTPFSEPPSYSAHGPKGPIALQDHGNPVRFRNIWVREFTPAQGEQVRPPFFRQGDKEWPVEAEEEASASDTAAAK